MAQSIHGTLWKAKYGLTGSIYWKKKFCYADEEKFLHWQTESRPAQNDTPPRHGFLLFRSIITEEPNIRACSFKIVDKVDNKSMIFATENVIEFEKWMKILNLPHPDPALTKLFKSCDTDNESVISAYENVIDESVHSNDGVSNSVEYITEYFHRNDVRESGLHCIDHRQAEQLLIELDPTISSPSSAASFIFSTLGATSGYISLPSFLSWWKAFEMDSQWKIYSVASKIVEKINPPSARAMGVHLTGSTALYTGIMDTSHIKSRKPTVSSLLKSNIPSCLQIIKSWPSGNHTDWNQGFQECYDSVANVAKHSIRGLKAMASSNTLARMNSQMSMISSSTLESDPVVFEFGDDIGTENLSKSLSLASFYGDFLEAALAGSKIIIDEYSLPDIFKTATSLSIDNSKCESCRNGNASAANYLENCSACSELVFSYEGLVYRIISHPAAEVDQIGIKTRTRDNYLNNVDKLNHKISSAESRAQTALQTAVAAVEESINDVQAAFFTPRADKEFLKSLLAIMKQDKIFNTILHGSKFNKIDGDLSNGICKLRTMLSCAVDYSGFRLQVFCPLLDLNPKETLVKGLLEMDGNQIFVDSSAHVNHALSKVAKSLNIGMGHIQVHQVSVETITKRGSERKGSSSDQVSDVSTLGLAAANIASTLTRDMQIHKGDDGRFYMLNLHSVLPCELPTASYDASCRLLRPEILGNVNHPISALAFRNDDFEEDPENSDPLLHLKLMEKEMKIRDQQYTSAVVEQLYSSQLPSIAGILDSLTFIPIDSFSLTNFLHMKGICCRHMGPLHDLCITNHSRQLLFTDAVARCCKILFGRVMRSHIRTARAVSLAAEGRKRSGENDFKEHQQRELIARKKVAVGYFNMVFGSGKESEKFWSETGLLADEMKECFGLCLASSRHENNIHMFQLFLAVQYYTGCIFADSAEYCLADSRVPRPFHISDFSDNSNFVYPTSKTFSGNIVIPGPLGSICNANEILGESLLACGLLEDSVKAFRIRLSIMKAASRGNLSSQSPKHIAAYCHVLYLLALALHRIGTIESNEEAKTLLVVHLSQSSKYTAISCRLMVLLAVIQIQLGDYTNAMLTFDAASTVCSTCFGANHPIVALNMCSLADAYRIFGGEKGTKQARVMLTLAVELSRCAMGELHATTTGYYHKLAILCVEQGAFEAAIPILQHCVDCYAEVTRVTHELLECLYLLALCYTQTKQIEDAIKCCERIFSYSQTELATRVHTSSSPVPEQQTHTSRMSAAELSALVLMSELCIRQKDLDGAQQYLTQALQLLHDEGVEKVNIGFTAAKLTVKILNLSLAKLSRQTRVFAETVALETFNDIPGKKITKIADAHIDLSSRPEWSERLNEVLEMLWKQNPSVVLDNLIKRSFEFEQAQSDLKSVTSEHATADRESGVVIQLSLLLKLISRK